MNTLRITFITVVMSCYGLPVPVVAQTTVEFNLPGATAGKLYSVNVAGVLRDTYHLKVETDSRTSVLRWAFAGGEMPPGLGIRANGTLFGTPRQSRAEPYRFEVSVVDLTIADSQPLKVDFNLTVTTRSIRLAQISVPRLSAVDGRSSADSGPRMNTAPSYRIDDQPTSGASQNHVEESLASPSFALRQPASNPLSFAPAPNPGAASLTTGASFRPATYDSGDRTAVTAYDAKLIKPLLRTLRAVDAGPFPNPEPIPSPKPDISQDVSKEVLSGDKIRGPATIELKNLNVLRYDIRVGKDATFPPAPDLKLPFIPPIPTQTKSAAVSAAAAAVSAKAGAAPAALNPIPDGFDGLVTLLNAIEGEKTTEVNQKIVQAISAVNLARGSLESLVTTSDSTLSTGGGPNAIILEVMSLTGVNGEIDKALGKTWPDEKIEELIGRLEILKNDLLTLPTTPVTGAEITWTAWYTANKSAYDAIVARVTELQTQLTGLKSNSTQGTAFREAQKKLRAWRPILIGVRDGGTAGFNRIVKVGCGFAFDTGKETKVKIIKTDRWAEPVTAPTNEEVVTVVCSSPLSVSAGFGFSNIDEREFVFVPSTKMVTANGQTSEVVISRFGFKNKSSFRTLPVLLLNTRVWEPNDTFALHVSTGAAVDVKTGEGGTDLEYIVGPSISFWRSLFVTSGLHIGRVPKLAGGFQLDQEVPTGISQPPIEKAWKKGFVTTFTYKIR